MTESRQQFLARVAAEHDKWVDAHLEDAPFRPESRPDSGDYNVWNVDLESDAQGEFFDAVGDVPENMTDEREQAPPATNGS